MSVDRSGARRDVVVENKAASAAFSLQDAVPVGLLSSLLVASVAVSSQYSVQRSLLVFSELHRGYKKISRGDREEGGS